MHELKRCLRAFGLNEEADRIKYSVVTGGKDNIQPRCENCIHCFVQDLKGYDEYICELYPDDKIEEVCKDYEINNK